MRAKIKIRWIPGPYGGWTVTCPLCTSVAVRETWSVAMSQAVRHRSIHETGPFAARRITHGGINQIWDGFHYDNLYAPPVSETHHA